MITTSSGYACTVLSDLLQWLLTLRDPPPWHTQAFTASVSGLTAARNAIKSAAAGDDGGKKGKGKKGKKKKK